MLAYELHAVMPQKQKRFSMSYADSYIAKLRQQVGNQELLVPGAQVLLLRGNQALFQRRTDSGEWEIPAGSAEPGQSFSQTAVSEVQEEIGLSIDPADLVAFASFSDPAEHRLVYPNGDVVHAFALCFVAERWQGSPNGSEEEVTEWAFYPLDNPPTPLRHSTQQVLKFYRNFVKTGAFQAF